MATTVCYEPAERLCGATKSVHDFQAPGSVLSCLQRNVEEVGDKCWQAVTTMLEDGDGQKSGAALGTDTAKMVNEVSDQVRSALLEEVSDSNARRSDDFGAAAACTVTELRKKADSLGTALSLVVFALVGVAAVAFLALRRMFTLLGRTRNEG
jgi:hypothetical protein